MPGDGRRGRIWPGGGGTGLADIAVGVPIGVADDPRRQTTTLPLAPGTVLCFFTDGLVERRHAHR